MQKVEILRCPARPNPIHGWIFYDAHCALCLASVQRVRRLFEARGFSWVPLQTPGSAGRLGVPESAFETRMYLMRRSGAVHHNADALGILFRSVWWLWPVGVLLTLPGLKQAGRAAYDWLARNRYCLGGACSAELPKRNAWGGWAWAMLVLPPALAWLLTLQQPAWVMMWTLAFTLFFECKWITFQSALKSGTRPSLKRALGYLFAWPGMGARKFLELKSSGADFRLAGWGLVNLSCGVALIWVCAPMLSNRWPLLAGWTGMIGIVLVLHFGLFALLAWAWQRVGVEVTPIMRTPLAAASIGDFWGQRWNTAFHELVRRYLFPPICRLAGPRGTPLVVFLLSGLVHELVVSVPARAGYGLPSLYFLIQGFGLLFERSSVGCALGLGKGLNGRFFALAVTVAPLGLLFHQPFMHRVVLPFLEVLGV